MLLLVEIHLGSFIVVVWYIDDLNYSVGRSSAEIMNC
jgi:hypothetical protein